MYSDLILVAGAMARRFTGSFFQSRLPVDFGLASSLLGWARLTRRRAPKASRMTPHEFSSLVVISAQIGNKNDQRCKFFSSGSVLTPSNGFALCFRRLKLAARVTLPCWHRRFSYRTFGLVARLPGSPQVITDNKYDIEANWGTPLIAAAYDGDVEAVRALLQEAQQGGSVRPVDRMDRSGRSALDYMLDRVPWARNYEIMELLLDAGASHGSVARLALPIEPSKLPASEAPESLALKMAETCDFHGIDGDGSRIRPLCAAVQANWTTVVQKLLERGAEVDAIGWQGRYTALNEAIHLRRNAIAVLLTARMPRLSELVGSLSEKKSKKAAMDLALSQAVGAKWYDIAGKLLDLGADPNGHAGNHYGPQYPPLVLAAEDNQVFAIRLVRAGADLWPIHGQSSGLYGLNDVPMHLQPLVSAARNKFTELIVEIAVYNMVKPLDTQWAFDVLSEAMQVHNGGRAVVVMVGIGKAPISCVDRRSGSSLLHLACANGDETLAKVLIKKGLSLSRKNFDGKSSLELVKVPGMAIRLRKFAEDPTEPAPGTV